MKYFYIYRITNTIDLKTYVGQRSCEGIPIKDTHYLGSGFLIKKAIKKYGKENFKKEILKEYSESEITREELGKLERYYIKQERERGHSEYNLSDGGLVPSLSGDLNPAKRQEVRKKISEKLLGRPGKPSPFKGQKQTEEFCKKISKSLIGNQRALGHKCSEEAKELMRQRKLGKRLSEEHKQKISESQKGKSISKEQKEKISKTLQGHIGANVGRICFNNGERNIFLDKEALPPEGFKRGFLRKGNKK